MESLKLEFFYIWTIIKNKLKVCMQKLHFRIQGETQQVFEQTRKRQTKEFYFVTNELKKRIMVRRFSFAALWCICYAPGFSFKINV